MKRQSMHANAKRSLKKERNCNWAQFLVQNFYFQSIVPIECCATHFRNRKDPNGDEVTDKAKRGHWGRKYSFGPKLTWGHYIFGKVQFIIHLCEMTASHAIIVLNQPIQLVVAWKKQTKPFDWIIMISRANMAIEYLTSLNLITCWRYCCGFWCCADR